MSISAKEIRDSEPTEVEHDDARLSSLPWWTWVLPLFVANLGTWLSLWFKTDPGVSLWYLPTALGIVMVYWWGPRALLGVYLNAVVCAPLWDLPWKWAPLYALPETIEVGLSWLLFVRLMRGNYWLPNLASAVQFLLFGSILPAIVANVYLVVQLFLLGDIAQSAMWENWLVLFSADLATHLVLAVPVLVVFTKFMSVRGWTMSQAESITNLPLLPENRRAKMDILIVSAVMISILILVWLAPLDRAWIIYGFLMIVLAIRYGVTAAILGSSWTGLLVFLLPPILANRLGSPTATYADFFILNLEILFLCAVSLLTGRAISDLFNEIRERTHSEEALRETRDRLALTTRSANVGLWDWDLRTNKVYYSPEWKSQLGYEEHEISDDFSEWEKRVHPDDLEPAKQIINAYLENPYPNYQNEFRMLHRDGLYRWILAQASLLTDEQGKPIRMMGSHIDITERKRIEAILQESEKRYRDLVEFSPVAMTVDVDGQTVYINPAGVKLWGANTPDEVLGRSSLEIVHPDYHEHINERIRQIQTLGQSPPLIEVKNTRLDGQVLYTTGTGIPITYQGKPAILSVVLDITERKQAEEKLRESENRFRSFMNNSATIAWMKDEQGRHAYLSESFEKQHGVRFEDWQGKTDFEVWPHETAEVFWKNDQEVLRTEKPLEIVEATQDSDGTPRYWLNFKFPFQDVAGRKYIGGIGIDITARKQAEESLRASEAFVHSLVESMPLTVVSKDLQGRFVFANQHFLKAEGKRLSEIVGKTDFDLYPLDLARKYRQDDQRVMEAGQTFNIEEENQPLGGSKSYVQVIKTPLYNPNEQVVGILVMYWDITARKRAEEKVQRQNQRLKALREIDTAILAADSVENIVGAALRHIRELIDCRRASVMLIDWETNEVLLFDVKTVGETSLTRGRRGPLTMFQDIMQTLSENQAVLINDLTALPDPPSDIQALIREGFRSLCSLPLLSQSNLIGTFNMLSEIPGFFDEEKTDLGREVANQVAIAITQGNLLQALRELNAKLEQRVIERTAQLQAANSELEAFSYSVSHDLRAPLRGIDGFSQALTRKYAGELGENGKHYLTRIQENTRRMGQLIDDLLSLARITRREMKQDHLNLSKMAREIAHELSAQESRRRVDFEIEDQVEAQGDAGLLKIVLQNLLGNAFKFTSKREEAIIKFGIQKQNDEDIFFVRDNGVGFDMTYADKLFGAFQRLHTMAEFPGTGIGLATVQRIIHRHGGRIWVEAEVDKGAVFHFTLGGSR